MNRGPGISSEDELMLQSYLDGELIRSEVEIVERRLAEEPRLSAAERAMREMFGDIVGGFVELEGDVRKSQVGSKPAAKPKLRSRVRKHAQTSDAARISLTIIEGTETSREISVAGGLTVERKVFSAAGRRVILEVATTVSSERIDEWLSSDFVVPPGMSSLVRRLPDNVGIRMWGEMSEEMLKGLKLQAV